MVEGVAVVTGASSGIGYQLARRALEDGHELILCADEPRLEEAADKLRRLGATARTVRADLATASGVETLWQEIADRRVALLFANAGSAVNGPLHDQDWLAIKRLIDLHIKQTTSLVHRVGRKMRAEGGGRILVTGSIAMTWVLEASRSKLAPTPAPSSTTSCACSMASNAWSL